VALKGQGSFFRDYPAAVVHHPEEAASPFGNLHGDLAGPCVQSVFHQLLHHRGRTGDHFARGNLGGGFRVQHLDARHLFPLPSRSPWFMIPAKEGCDPVLLTSPRRSFDGLLLIGGVY